MTGTVSPRHLICYETNRFCSTFVYYNQKLINTPNYDVLLWNQVVEKNYEQALKDPKVLARFELHLCGSCSNTDFNLSR